MDIHVVTYDVNDYNQHGEYFKGLVVGELTAEKIQEVGVSINIAKELLENGNCRTDGGETEYYLEKWD